MGSVLAGRVTLQTWKRHGDVRLLRNTRPSVRDHWHPRVHLCGTASFSDNTPQLLINTQNRCKKPSKWSEMLSSLAIISLNPSILTALFRLYPKKSNATSHRTFRRVRRIKWPPFIVCLTVPKGCSTICCRSLYKSKFSLNTRSALSYVWAYWLRVIVRYSFLPLVQTSMWGQLLQAVLL